MEGHNHPFNKSWPALVFLAWTMGLLSFFWILDPTENIFIQHSPALENPVPAVGFPGLFNSLGGFLLGSLMVVSWLGFGTQLHRLLPSTSAFQVPGSTKERRKSRADSGRPLKPDFLTPGRHEAALGPA